MKQLVLVERICAIGHGLSMAFGIIGLLYVMPNPDFVASLPPLGLQVFQWSLSLGGVGYIVLGALAMVLFLGQSVGWRRCALFFVPAVALSLGSELLGTSTGFPFGAYHYLTGLGYKVAGLVPFTIPLSWFYMGALCYVLARAVLEVLKAPVWVQRFGAVAVGAVLLTGWDLVLDPAMSQTAFPFWEFEEVGAFFGMPYRNLSGWVGTGAVFMTVAALLWNSKPVNLTRDRGALLAILYVVNFGFGAIITLGSLDSQFWIPTALSVLVGVVPVLVGWWLLPTREAAAAIAPDQDLSAVRPLEVVAK
ncbi:MAG: carotenoid biosynthesis protein [Cyanophyceae cyanobacterium]